MPIKKADKKNKNSKKVAIKVKIKAEKPIGLVTHYFSHLKVGIIKFKKAVKIGDEIQIKGATTDFKQVISSMQYDHKDIKAAPPNKEIGVKVKDIVREGDEVFK